ncbi:MAG: hypothetical protein HAW59_00130 [Betaproteobacteria bacterium]|nr:hypothetical protein [Betaproteobacteria bacterium]
MKNKIILICAVLGGFILAGCGGGGGVSAQSPQQYVLSYSAEEAPIVRAFNQLASANIPVDDRGGLFTVVLNSEDLAALQQIIADFREAQMTVTTVMVPPPPPPGNTGIVCRNDQIRQGDICLCPTGQSEVSGICMPSAPNSPLPGDNVITVSATHSSSGLPIPTYTRTVEYETRQSVIVTLVASHLTPYQYTWRYCGYLETGQRYERDRGPGHPIEFMDDFGIQENYLFHVVRQGQIVVPRGHTFRFTYDVLPYGSSKLVRTNADPIQFRAGDEIVYSYEWSPNRVASTVILFEQQGDLFFGGKFGDLKCEPVFAPEIPFYQFAFPPGLFQIPSNLTIFSLRENLRGYMDESAAVRLDNFFFVADTELRDLHLEYRATPFETENFALHADSGFRRWGQNGTNAAYMKITGMRALSPLADIYAQASFGEVRSDFWKNGQLRGLAAGMFYGNLLRHDDSYHLRFEQPFAAAELAHWQIAADARFGVENRYLRFRFWRNMQNGKQGANLFLMREF